MPVAINMLIPSMNGTFTANLGDTAYTLEAGSTLISPNTDAVDARDPAANRHFTINGEIDYTTLGLVVGEAGTPSPANTVVVGKTGYLHGAQTAIWMDGVGHSATNHGSIYSDGAVGSGIRIIGDAGRLINHGSIHADTGLYAQGNDAFLLNTGTMSGDYGMWSNSGFGTTSSLVNKGTITALSDAIHALNGNDRVVNFGTLNGDVSLGEGDDVFISKGGTVNGWVRGRQGNDTYVIDDENITIQELDGQGFDVVKSSVSFDNIATSIEKMILTGKNDADLTGFQNADILFGNAGRNEIDGGNGNDTIRGGKGNDILTGGGDADTFIFIRGGGKDIVTDFNATMDIIDISAFSGIDNFNDLENNHAVEKGGNLIITDGNDVIVLKNTSLNDLDAANFAFDGLGSL